MPTNDFKAFATGNGANVISQADYLALAALVSGFSSGKASSAQVNKALRQATVMANVLAQFIADSANVDVLDNGNTAAILSNLKNSMPGRLLGVQVVTSSALITKSAGAKKWRIRALGAGAGSSAAPATAAGQVSISNGGGAGAYAEGIYDVSALSSATVTIGSGGVGGTAISPNGGDGGTTSVGTLISAPGGKAGLPAGPANPPFQPVANTNSNSPTGWNIIGTSGSGSEAAVAVSTSYAAGSRGANSQLGVGGSVPAINTPANTGGGYGSGASGCSNGVSQSLNPGASGRDGVVIIEEYA
ncbi:glycine-rich domain-containing protein [Klebsiella michiganensis]|uniref:glycine-rich domain-containing protein n=1 Tax=Klebsiella michiganensis TaxID=1134687 RepID=UPI003886B45E